MEKESAMVTSLEARILLLVMLASVGAGASAATPEPKQPSMTDSFAAAREIANEVRQIEKRMAAVEVAVEGMNASLKPVGALAQPEAISKLTHDAVDQAMNRLTWLLLIATACLAGLMVLGTLCWSWAGKLRPKS
jgi:hypothetical protein